MASSRRTGAVPPTEGDHGRVPAIPGELAALADLVTPMALRVAVAVGLPDALRAGPVGVEALADELEVDAAVLARLVRFLAARGVVAVDGGGSVRLTSTGAPLASAGSSWPARLDWAGAAGHLDRRFVTDLMDVLRTGRCRRDVWAELAEDPALGASFDGLMGARSAEWVPAVVALDTWAGVRSVVDVGGGRGHLLRALLAAWPHLRGVLVERPQAAAAALRAAPSSGHRARVVVGDVREPLPRGADAYVLAHVLHDWDDATATTILRRAAEAAGATGRVVVIERLLDDAPDRQRDVTHQDLRLLVLFGGRERTRAEFAALGAAAGLTVRSTQPTSTGRHVLTFRAARTGGGRAGAAVGPGPDVAIGGAGAIPAAGDGDEGPNRAAPGPGPEEDPWR